MALGWLPDWLVTRGGSAAALTAGLAFTGHGDVAAGVAIVAAGVAALEAGHTVRRLEARSRLELLPEVEFVPTPDDVARVGRLLTGARPRGPLGWAWRSGAVRVCLEAEGGQDVRYTWTADTERMSALTTTARALARVEVRPADPWRLPAGAVAVRELRRAGRAIDTLAGLGETTDPLQIATRTLEELEAGQYGAVLVDLMPATARHARRQRDRIRREADLIRQAEGLGHRVRGAHRARALAERIDPDSAIYRAQVFCLGVAETEAEAAEIAAQLEAGWAQWSGSAHWRRVHSIPAWRRYRAGTGLFAPRRPSHVTAREVGAWLRPPTAANASIRVRRSLGALSRPPDILVPYTGEPEQLPVGAVDRRGRSVMLAADLTQRPGQPPTPWFGYIVGGSGSGKSELAILQALHIALRTDRGLLFLDPHGQAIERLLAFLIGTPAESRITIIDLGRGLAPNPGLNLLDRSAYEREHPGEDWGAAQELARALRDTMAQAMHWNDRANRVQGLLGRATLALAELGRQLPPDLQPTIFELERLLLDPGWRLAVAPLLGSASQRAWWGERGAFESQPKDVIGAVLSMGDRLRSSPALSGLLGQSQASWRAREAMDRGDIVLVRTGEEPADAALASALLVTHVYHAALTRGDLPESERRPFHLFLDELQTFDSEAGGIIGASLEQLRKFGVRLTAMNQDPSRLSPRTLAALANNRTHMAAGTTRARVAGWLADELGGDIDRRSIARLPFHRFISAVKVEGQNSDPFLIATVRAEDLFTRMVPVGGEGAAYVALRDAVAARTGALRPRVVVEGLEAAEARMLAALGVSEPHDVGDPVPDMAELPADPRTAARVLRDEHRWSFARIATAQGVSVATVRRRLGLLDERGQKPRPHVLPGGKEAG